MNLVEVGAMELGVSVQLPSWKHHTGLQVFFLHLTQPSHSWLCIGLDEHTHKIQETDAGDVDVASTRMSASALVVPRWKDRRMPSPPKPANPCSS